MSPTNPESFPPPPAPSTAAQEVNVVALLLAGGKARHAAVGQLYARYARLFKGYFRCHGTSDAQADDLVQETFVKVIRGLESWSGAGTLEAWLWTVARNTLLSEVRGRRSNPATVSLDEQEPEVAEGLLNRAGASSDPADTDCVRRGLEGFVARHAEPAYILERVALDGWDDDDLAAYRGCKPGAARQYLADCRKRLWPYISHCYQQGSA